jgi:hypothetical protein
MYHDYDQIAEHDRVDMLDAQEEWIRNAPYVHVTLRIGESFYVGCTAYLYEKDTLTITPVPAPGGLGIPTVINPGRWRDCTVYNADGTYRFQFISGTPVDPILTVAELHRRVKEGTAHGCYR